jgi:hypothetical protein
MLGHSWITAILALFLGMPAPGPAPVQAPVAMKVKITVESRTQTLRGTGRCAHEPNAWIYDNPAALWLAEYPAAREGTRLTLSFWRMRKQDMEPQFSLSVLERSADHRISTVKGGKLEGSGHASFHPTARGGRFEIAGKAHDGTSLKVTIECARFGGIHAEGG